MTRTLTLLALLLAVLAGAFGQVAAHADTAPRTAYGITQGVVVGIAGSGAQVDRGRVIARYPAGTFRAAPRARTLVRAFEDGSGVQYLLVAPRRWVRARAFPADTFGWDARTMGNRQHAPQLGRLLASCDPLPPLSQPACWQQAYARL